MARKPLNRFLALAESATWPHFPAVKEIFPAADYAPATGMTILDIDGNKYRVIAVVNFERQAMWVQSVLTHEEYTRRKL